MANMKEIHSRMKSIKDIMKITNAMYLISSSKLKKARKSLAATEPYFEKLLSTMQDILALTPEIGHVYFDRREHLEPEKRKRGYIVVTADKGLAGAYNHNVIKMVESEMANGENNHLFVVGQVGRQYFKRKNAVIDREFVYSSQYTTKYRAREIAETVLDLYEKGELDDVYVIYTKMITPLRSETQMIQILPFDRDRLERKEKKQVEASFQPSPEEVIAHLVPNYVRGLLYGVLIEAFSSEQNARMMAMDAATNSAKDMLKSLDLQYNRARQAAITQEITEIVSGAKSLQK